MDTNPSPSDQPVPVNQLQPPATRVAEADLRASDADRERIAELLRDAYAEGRLSVEEHSERIEAAYTARTLGELAPLTRDLPSHPAAPAQAPRPAAVPLPPARDESANILAIFGGVDRKGRWRVGSHIRATAAFGGISLDLSDAVFESPEVLIEVSAFCGGVSIRVPENVTLVGSGVGIFGGFDVREQTAADPYAPVVRVKGVAVFGGCDAKARRGKKLKEWVRRQIGA
ncbi:hypothetical protein C7C46_25910 [Streptomyces tateyamensis]|uniref:DUF1707 domain-containing protein n=1 Tax=Streptomyces tateyamensis TaxID=565073 RepID=A0A2V4NVU9_9ACTN|nr:hypothetical protein C7C46_25910 [Streptomyces tateyamensis]